MTFNDKLDSILLGLSYAFLKNSQPGDSDTGVLLEKLCEAFKMDVTSAELVLFKEILLGNGFIEYVRKDSGYPLFRLTIKGLDFITTGGYVKQIHNETEIIDQIPNNDEHNDELNIVQITKDKESSNDLKPDLDGYLTVAQAARYLGLSPSSIYRLSGQSNIRCYKPGREKKFLRKDLDAYIATGLRPTRQEIKEEAQKSLYIRKKRK